MPTGVFAAIFDLDGVLTSTSVRHEQSWADAAARFGVPVSEAALHATRSVPRASALSALLDHAGITMPASDREALMAFKNERYHQLIESLQPADAFPGAHAALARCRELSMKIGIASASMNAALVLERIGLQSLVDFVADPGKGVRLVHLADIPADTSVRQAVMRRQLLMQAMPGCPAALAITQLAAKMEDTVLPRQT